MTTAHNATPDPLDELLEALDPDKPYTFHAGLRALADLLETHESAHSAFDDYRHVIYTKSREELLAVVRDLGGHWQKDEAPGDYFGMTRDLGDGVSVYVYAARDLICERVQIGTRKVQRPADDAPMVEVEEPVYEYRCPPSLLDLGSAA